MKRWNLAMKRLSKTSKTIKSFICREENLHMKYSQHDGKICEDKFLHQVSSKTYINVKLEDDCKLRIDNRVIVIENLIYFPMTVGIFIASLPLSSIHFYVSTVFMESRKLKIHQKNQK